MLNFTVGPVRSSEVVLEIGSQQVPYFRTPEFSEIMKENEKLMLELIGAPQGSRVVFLTGSGTAAMESAVMNMLGENDTALIVNGGSFGQRFCKICEIHGIQYDQITLEAGQTLREQDLGFYDPGVYNSFLVNMHETSTGVLYDLGLISRYCRQNNHFLIVDAISSFLADDLDMEKSGVDVIITGSQKALACPPGVSIIVMAPRAQKRVFENPVKCMYLDLKSALKDGERGQTPFTPAVSILLQINARLKAIVKSGGSKAEVAKVSNLASDFRSKIAGLPFEIASDNLSNAVTPLKPLTAKATDIFRILKDEYKIWVCPNGGEMAETRFRVGHIGAHTTHDNDILVAAFRDMQSRGII